MKQIILSFCLAVSTVGASLPLRPFPVSYAGARSPYEASVDLARPERERIRAHLERVEADLRAHPPEGLNEAQRAARAARLDDLHAYWTRGEFPINRDHPDRLIPYFIDADGVPCAMGYLVIASGHSAFAEEIRRTRNNAYIPEVAAADGRLAAWLEASGMTLEEAARVQPAYGSPSLIAVLALHLDSLGRVWAHGPDGNAVGGAALFRRDTLQWRVQQTGSLASGHCITASGLVATVDPSGPLLRWKNRNYSVPPFPGNNRPGCAWDRDDKALWIGTTQGLRRYARQGPSDTLSLTTFSTSGASDTVLSVAATDAFVVAGTTRGIAHIFFSGQSPVLWDSASLGGWRVTSLRDGGGRNIWGGLEGRTFAEGMPIFSTRGLLRYDGTTWRRYRATMSSVLVPGDTIFALAPRDTASVWIATSMGFHVFSGTGDTPKMADLPSGVQVYSLVDDGAGGFYAGTSNGVYRYQGGTLARLPEQPVVSLARAFVGKGGAPARGLRALTRAEAARAAETGALRDLRGRQAVRGAAQGVYAPEAEAAPSASPEASR